jgi:hypothetical protein
METRIHADIQARDVRAAAVARRAERAERDAVEWNEPATLVALAIAALFAVAIVALLAIAIV